MRLLMWTLRSFRPRCSQCWGRERLWISRSGARLGWPKRIWNFNKQLRKTILSPILTPAVLNQPAGLSVSHVPANDLHSLTSGESLSSGIHLVEALLVYKKISVDGNDSQDRAVVEDLLLDVLELFWDAVVGDFVFLAVGGLLLAFLWAWEGAVIAEAQLFDEAVDFCVIQSSWKISTLAVVVDRLITRQWPLRRQHWERQIIGPAPSVSNRAHCSNRIRGWAISLINNFSRTIRILLSKIISLRDDRVLITSVA